MRATASPQPAGGATPLSPQAVSAKGAHQAQSIYNHYYCFTPTMRLALGLNDLGAEIHRVVRSAHRHGYDPDQVAMQIVNEATLACAQIRLEHAVKERSRDRDVSLAEAAQRLSPEGVAARPEGIAR